MVAMAEEKTVIPFKEVHESKNVQLLKLIRGTLPSDNTASVVGYSFDLTDLSQKVGMSDPEFSHFLRANKGLLVRSKQASKNNGPAEFTFIDGFENVQDVNEFIASSLPKRVIPYVRPRGSVYRGPR